VLVHFQHPDDKNEAWLPKGTVILGFVMAGASVLLMPLDVANNENYVGCIGYDTEICGGLDMEIIWNIFYWAIPAMLFVLIPFMTFYYEADDGTLMAGTSIGSKPKSRLYEALKYEILLLVAVGILFVIMYVLFRDSEIPVTVIKCNLVEGFLIEINPDQDSGIFETNWLPNMNDELTDYDTNFEAKDTDITMEVSINTFFAAFMTFIGWFLFALFGGIGLAALPLDLIMGYINRPHHMDAAEFADAQLSIRDRVNDLVDVGELLKIENDENSDRKKTGAFNRLTKEGREAQKVLLEFKKAVFLLEEDVEDLQNCSSNYAKYNPLVPYFSLLGGILAIVISITWVVQVCVYVLPKTPYHPFLNNYFRWFDTWFPLFGILSVAVYALYLLCCAIKGCFKFGLRFLFFQIHPMKVNKTYMSSFMFNVGLILLCALPVVQFCTIAFSDYARYTNIYQVMGTQVYYMKFFKWFWRNNVFIIAFLSIFGLSSLYLICKPREVESSLELRDRIKSRR